MTTVKHQDMCPLCRGIKEPGFTTFTVDLGTGVVVVRDLPATICSLCGEEWIDDSIAGQLEAIVNDARKKRMLVEIASLSGNTAQGTMPLAA